MTIDVTVAVIPRERFRPLPASLRSLFSTLSPDVPVIVVDGGADEKTRQEVLSLQNDRSFELVKSDKFLLPNMARNIALEKAKTKYLAFCDNDLSYSPEWLEALIANAEQNGAVAVAPITLIGPSKPQLIHHAGGELRVTRDKEGKTRLKRHHRLGRLTLPDAEKSHFQHITSEHDYFEYHCVLVKVEAMRAVGGHDERLVTHEHLDSALRLKAAGGKITFEPKARVMYTAFVRFNDEDWPYFLHRWSQQRAELSNQVFAENWGVTEDSGYAELHRDRAMMTVLPRLPKVLNRYRIKRALLRLYKFKIESLDLHTPDDPAAKILARPAPDAFHKIGIEQSTNADAG